MCNPLHLVERGNSETPYTIDINSKNAIIRLEVDAGRNEQLLPDKRLKMGVYTWVLREEKI